MDLGPAVKFSTVTVAVPLSTAAEYSLPSIITVTFPVALAGTVTVTVTF